MTSYSVKNYGAVPCSATAAKTDSRAGILNAIKAVKSATTTTNVPTLYFPGASGDTYWTSDQIVWDAAGKSTSIVMDPGVRMKFLPNRALPTVRSSTGWLQGRHLFVISNVDQATFRTALFDLNGAQQTLVDAAGKQSFVGDTLRVQNFNVVDAKDVTAYNGRGLTTNSTIDLPETFAIQWAHGNKVLENNVSQLALDGAPTATGIVSHWVKQTVAVGGVSHGVSGQGFGTYGGGSYSRKASWANQCGNGFNFEGGNTGMTNIVLGDPIDPAQACLSTKNRRAIVVNGNPGKITSLDFYDFKSDTDATFMALTGTLPGVVRFFKGTVQNTTVNLFNMLAGSNNQNALNLISVAGLRVHKASTIPLVVPKTLVVPKAWTVTYF